MESKNENFAANKEVETTTTIGAVGDFDKNVIAKTEIPIESDFVSTKSGYLCVKKLFFPKLQQTLTAGDSLVLADDKSTATFIGAIRTTKTKKHGNSAEVYKFLAYQEENVRMLKLSEIDSFNIEENKDVTQLSNILTDWLKTFNKKPPKPPKPVEHQEEAPPNTLENQEESSKSVGNQEDPSMGSEGKDEQMEGQFPTTRKRTRHQPKSFSPVESKRRSSNVRAESSKRHRPNDDLSNPNASFRDELLQKISGMETKIDMIWDFLQNVVGKSFDILSRGTN